MAMRVQFLKDTTVDVSKYPCETEEKLFLKNTEIDVDEIIPVSSAFTYLVLTSGDVLLDVRNDLFRKMVS